jgi:hypothetical protein
MSLSFRLGKRWDRPLGLSKALSSERQAKPPAPQKGKTK